MTETVVAYHHGEDGIARPAIDVKDHNGGDAYAIALQRVVAQPTPPILRGANEISIHSMAYEHVRSDFWQTAEQVAQERGLGEIVQEGRSGGWLVFTQYDPQDPSTLARYDEIDPEDGAALSAAMDDERRAWLANYRAMSEWADRYIADAPKKVAALAQQWAMDEAGEAAALRMFAFGRGLSRIGPAH